MTIEVILLKGQKQFEIKTVARGYARYLIAQGKALPKKDNEERLESLRAEQAHAEQQAIQHAKDRASRLEVLNVKIESRAVENQQLYGSLGPNEIAHAITEAGVTIDKKEVMLSDVIRHVGTYNITLHLHPIVHVVIKVQVIAI